MGKDSSSYSRGINHLKYIGILFSKIIPALFAIFHSTLILAQVLSSESQCLECHSDTSQLKELSGQYNQLFILPEFSELSVHNEINCTGCHADSGGYPHPEIVGLIQCGSCHEVESNEYLSGLHGNPLAVSMDLAPKCWDCHKLHLMRSSSDADSEIHRNNEWKTCAKCHSSVDFISTQFERVTIGIHSSVMKDDPTAKALRCSDCHGTHLLSKIMGEKWRSDYSSEQEYCKECHVKESVEYGNSVHSKTKLLTSRGEITLVCSDCHGEHEEIHPEEKRNELSSHLMTNKCSQCHSPVIVDSKYALKARGYTPYLTSLHGVKSLNGQIVFTNCASCHGIHEVEAFITTDPIIRAGLIVNKCGDCHPSVSEDLSNSRVHLSAMEPVEMEIFYSQLAMKVIIGLTILLISITVFGDIYRVVKRKIG